MTTKKKTSKATQKKTTPRKPRPRPFCFTDDLLDPAGEPYKFSRLETKFISEYLNDPRHVGSHAAKAAGFDAKSDAAFRVIASQLLRKPSVLAAINRAFESLTMPKYETLYRVAKIAAGDLDDLLNDDGEFDIDLARERNMTFLLKKIEIDRDVIEVKTSDQIGTDETLERSIVKEKIKIQIHDPLRALELLGKHGKLWVERIEATGKDGQPLIPEDGPQVVFYIPDNGRGDSDGHAQTQKQTTRTTPAKASRTRARNDE
jgi:hypothetical protein